MRAWPIVVSLIAVSSTLAAEPAADLPNHPAKICSIDDFLPLSECELLDLYRHAGPGPVPIGFSAGRVLPAPGKPSNVAKSNAMKHVWQGKYFDCDGIMTNRLLGMKIIKGQVTRETSWIDGKPVNAIDYSHTSLLFKPYRDEFREIAPGIYLGTMWKRDDCKPKMLTWFALDARCR
jgi:hypothetical protein